MLNYLEHRDSIPEWARDSVERFAKIAIEANSSSDRACAIVMLVAIEELLRLVLEKYLPDTGVKLSRLVPPGRVALAVDVAEATGLITANIAATIRGLNGVRNQFAHKVLESPSFGDKQISQKLESVPEPFTIEGLSADADERARFMRLCGTIVINLTLLRGYVPRLEVQNPALAMLRVVAPATLHQKD